MIRRRPFLLTLLVLLFASTALGNEPPPAAAPVDLAADELQYDRPSETMYARGNVRLQKGDLTLLSDVVRWNAETAEAEAAGSVRLTGPQAIVEGESLNIDLDTGVGRLTDARILVRESNYRIAGEQIERLGEDRYLILDGDFTTCDGQPPAWKFTASRFDVTLGGYARARHVVFHLYDLPVLYIPYIAYPVKTERESGFLMPRIGSSSKRGFQLSLAWYQVIDRHLDATFYFDYLSKLGIGNGLEYRYVLGEETEGVAHGYYVAGLKDEEDRYALDWEHAGRLSDRTRLIADVEYVSSRDYYEDFGLEASEYNKEQAQSVIALTHHWRLSSLNGQVRYTKDLENDNDQTLQQLPELTYSALPNRLGETSFFLAFDTAYTHFWRQEGVTGQRFTVRPELSAVFHPGDFLEIRPAVGYRERFYWTSDEGSGSEREGTADFSTSVSSRFSRIYALDGRTVSKIRHSIEPEITYRFIPYEDQSHLPVFNALDRIEEKNGISYALVNRLLGRLERAGGMPVYHEVLYLRLSQTYDFEEPRDLPVDARKTPFSPLRTELIVRPNERSFLDLDAKYDVNSGGGFADRLQEFSARGGVRDDDGNAMTLDYQYQKDNLSYLGSSIDIAWLRPIYLNYLHRQDLDEGRLLEQALNLEYRAQCWSLYLTVRDRLDETEYLVSFSLSGLGKIAELGGALGQPR